MGPQRTTLIPRALKKGDTIAFVSPSSRLNDVMPAALARGKAFLESLGFQVRVIFKKTTLKARIGELIRVRCEEIREAFADPDIKAIICTIGGSHANELLPFLDYNLIRSNPKIFMGYSDTTFLHWAIESRTGLRTFYGPSILSDLADVPKPLQFTIDHMLQVLTKSEPVGSLPQSKECTVDHPDFFLGNVASENPRELAASPPWRWVRKGTAEGQLYGGTITCVERLVGTRYEPESWKGRILFLESAMGDDASVPFSVARFRNNLADLALSGMLDDIVGLVVGRGYKYSAKMQDELSDVIEDLFTVISPKEEAMFPVLMNVDFGHTGPFLTLPLNARARLDSSKGEFTILEPGVQA